MGKCVARRTSVGLKTFFIVRPLLNEFFGHGPYSGAAVALVRVTADTQNPQPANEWPEGAPNPDRTSLLVRGGWLDLRG